MHYSSKLTFNLETVPPKWKTEPVDRNVERNRHIMLDCQAEGVPTPTVVWKKATGKFVFILDSNLNRKS